MTRVVEPITREEANTMLSVLSVRSSLDLAGVLVDLDNGLTPDRALLVTLPKMWQRLVCSLAYRLDLALEYPTWKYHEGLDRWIYLPLPAWKGPGYCEACGEGNEWLNWDRVGGGWRCQDCNEDHQLTVTGVILPWPTESAS